MKTTIGILALTLLLGLAEGVRGLWFGAPPSDDRASTPILHFVVPEDAERLSLAGTRASKALSYDAETVLRWQEDGVEVIHLQYDQGNDRLWVDLFNHSPEICLPNSGSTLLETFPSRVLQVGEQELVFRHLLFKSPFDENPLHIFKMIWLRNMMELAFKGDENDRNLARTVAIRSRYIPRGSLTLAIVRRETQADAAWLKLRTHLEKCYQLKSDAR